jgi:site-specific DNA-methyltransferase (adenine-specific)
VDPALVTPGLAETFVRAIVAMDDPEALWESATTCDALVQKWVGHVTAQEEAGYLQLYCEIQLGEVLGPPPGAGPGRGNKGRNSDLLIPKQTRSELRAFHGHRDRLVFTEIPADRQKPRKDREYDSRYACLVKARAWNRRVRLLEDRAAATTGPMPEGLLLLEVADARRLPLDDDSVDLIVTSPPYGLDIEYTGGDIAHEAWPTFMADWLREAYRVTKPHGRLALNVPLDSSVPVGRPTYAQSVVAAIAGAGWEYAATVVWNEGNTTKGGHALGTQSSSRRPHHVSQVEMIAILSKGRMDPSSGRPDDITPEEFLVAGRGPWTFSGESRPWEEHPAAFPLELPRRLIPYLCRVGDVVLDPFAGSGTTLVAALERGRRAIGFDASIDYVESIRRRLLAGL